MKHFYLSINGRPHCVSGHMTANEHCGFTSERVGRAKVDSLKRRFGPNVKIVLHDGLCPEGPTRGGQK